MKKGEHAAFSAKWWKDSQPRGLSKAHALESALHAYETARHAHEEQGTALHAKAANSALDTVEAAVKAVTMQASKAGGTEMTVTVTVLESLDFNKERAWVKDREKDEDDDGDSPFSQGAYGDYLRVRLRLLRARPLNFALVLGKQPAGHRLALHRVQSPLAMGHGLMRDTGLHLMTYGVAQSDETRDRTIRLTVEGRQLPRMKNRLERMFKAFRPLPFQAVSLFAGGAELEDLIEGEEDEDDLEVPDAGPIDRDGDLAATLTEPALRTAIQAIMPRLNAAMNASTEKRSIIRHDVERFVAHMKAGDLPGARAVLIALRALVPGVHDPI